MLKAVPPKVELTYSIQKVPLPIPVLRADGPPYVSTASKITINAEGRPSSCARLVDMDLKGSIQYHWNGSNLGIDHALSTLHVPSKDLETQTRSLFFHVEAESSADPRAIASSTVEIIRIPTTLRLIIMNQGKYTLLSVMYEEGVGLARNKTTVAGARFKWSCQVGSMDRWSQNGSKLDFTDDHGILQLNPSDFQKGIHKTYPCLHPWFGSFPL